MPGRLLKQLWRVLVATVTLGNLRPGEDERWAAVHAQRLEPTDQHAAEGLYDRMVPGRRIAKWRAFATRWNERAVAGLGISSKEPSGRPPIIYPDQAQTIALDWTQHGVGSGDRWRPYHSTEEVRGGGGAPHWLPLSGSWTSSLPAPSTFTK